MTISKIKVKNFQSILDGEVELGQFTVFTGPSSSGKSAFVRAAHAVIRNSFNPTQVTVGHKVSEVSVEVDDHDIKAIRGKSKSTYVLDGVEYTKAGRNVPDAILDVLSMPEVSDIETSFSYQFDKPYLLADPGSVASKVIGSLTNVSVLHASLKESNRRNRELGSRLKVKGSDLEEVEEKIETYQEIEDLVRVVEDTDKIINSIEKDMSTEIKITSRISTAESLLESISVSQGLMSEAESIEALAEEASSMSLSKVSTLDTNIETIDSLTSSLPAWDFNNVPESLTGSDEITEIKQLSDILEVESLIASLPQWDFNSVPQSGEIIPLTDVQGIDSLLNQFNELMESLRRCEPKISEYENEINALTQEHDDLLKDIEVCPLCLTPLHK